MPDYLTAGQVAKPGGVNIQTVRYYERRRLLLCDRRAESGYRLYAPEAVRVLRFIKNAQDLGFTLDEVAQLLRLRVGHRGQCGAVRRQAEARLAVVHGKIAGLRAMRRALKRLVRTCATDLPDRIKRGIAEGRCDCGRKNPQGACCLGNVAAAIREIRGSAL